MSIKVTIYIMSFKGNFVKEMQGTDLVRNQC